VKPELGQEFSLSAARIESQGQRLHCVTLLGT